MDYRSSWNLWVHPVWNAFLSNPAYYYYCTAKAALQNQPNMVRKSGNVPMSRQPQVTNNAMVPVGVGENGRNNVLKLFGVEECPECKSRLDLIENRPLKEFCGHIRCRRCLIKATPCVQCKQSSLQTSPPRKIITNGISNGSGISPAVVAAAAAASSPMLPSSRNKPPAEPALTPTRTYPPHVRSYGTSRNQNGVGEGGGSNSSRYRYNHNSSRLLNGSDKSNKMNGFTTISESSGFLGRKASPQVDQIVNHRAHPMSTTVLVTNNAACKFSVEAVKVLKTSSVGGVQQVIPSSSNPEIISNSVGIRYVSTDLGIPPSSSSYPSTSITTTPTTMDKSSSSSSSCPIPPSPSTTMHLKTLKTKDLSPTPPPSFENPTSSQHPDSPSSGSGGDEPGSSSRGLNRKKKKRHPVVIHDHITVISGDPTMFQCNVCMKKFKTKAHIKYHEFCQNGEKPFKCEQCGQGFIAKSHYEYHLRTHTGERPYVCPKCNKGFNQRGKVTRHMRSHTGEKPFVCDECQRGFANAQALRSHHLIHTGERPFACKYCNKRFTGMTNLKKHIITHTGERPYVCTHCSKSFGLKWTLDLHLRTHSSERPYACDQCTRAFSNSKDLRRHLVIHSGERPFKCWICGTAFRRKDNLDRHIKNTHNQPKEVAKQLANEAAAEYLIANNANSPVPTSKVNSAVISNVIRTAQLNGPTPAAAAPAPLPQKQRLKKPMSSSNPKKRRINKKIIKKTIKPALNVVVINESSSTVPNEVFITAQLSPRNTPEDTEKIVDTANEATKIEQSSPQLSPSREDAATIILQEEFSTAEAKIEQESSSPQASPQAASDCYDPQTPATPEETPNKDTIEKESNNDNNGVENTTVAVVVLTTDPDSPPPPPLNCDNDEKIESETFENYILPDTEESYTFNSTIEVEEKFHPQSPSSGSFMGFASHACGEEAEQKLRSHESPHGADGLSDFSKSRNLTPSDCGIRLFDKVGPVIPPDTAQLDLTSIISHANVDEDTEHVFVDEKETQTIFEEFDESNLEDHLDCKILVGRPRSIFPEGEYERCGEVVGDMHSNSTTTTTLEDSPVAESVHCSTTTTTTIPSPQLSPRKDDEATIILQEEFSTIKSVLNAVINESSRVPNEVFIVAQLSPRSTQDAAEIVATTNDDAKIEQQNSPTQPLEDEKIEDAEEPQGDILAVDGESQVNNTTTPAPEIPVESASVDCSSTTTIASSPAQPLKAKDEDIEDEEELQVDNLAVGETQVNNTTTTLEDSPSAESASVDCSTTTITSSPQRLEAEDKEIEDAEDKEIQDAEEPKGHNLAVVGETQVTNTTTPAPEIPAESASVDCSTITTIASSPQPLEAEDQEIEDAEEPKGDILAGTGETQVNITTTSPEDSPAAADNENGEISLATPIVEESPEEEEEEEKVLETVSSTRENVPLAAHTTTTNDNSPRFNYNNNPEESYTGNISAIVAEAQVNSTTTTTLEDPPVAADDENREISLGISIVEEFPDEEEEEETVSSPTRENGEISLATEICIVEESPEEEEEKVIQTVSSPTKENVPLPAHTNSPRFYYNNNPEESYTGNTLAVVGETQVNSSTTTTTTVEDTPAAADNENGEISLGISIVEEFPEEEEEVEEKEKVIETASSPTRENGEISLARGISIVEESPEEEEEEEKVLKTVSPTRENVPLAAHTNNNRSRFYYHNNPEEPYTGNMYYPAQIGIEHPYSPHNNHQQQQQQQQENTMNVLYATATAQAERNFDESGPPLKIRLLHAEAFGVQNCGENLSERRVFYTSTRPNQVIEDYSSPTIALSSPAIIHPPETRGSSPLVTIHQYRYMDQEEAHLPTTNQLMASQQQQQQYPVEVSYENNGIVHAQTISDHPDRSSLIHRAREASRELPEADYYSLREWNGHDVYNLHQNNYHQQQQQGPQIPSYSQPHPHSQSSQMGSNYYGIHSNDQSQEMMINYHQHALPDHHHQQQQQPQQSSPQDYKMYNPLRQLATEAARRLTGRDESYNATIAAAQAIAAVGEEARKQREEELKHRLLLDERVRSIELQRRDSRKRSAASRKTYY